MKKTWRDNQYSNHRVSAVIDEYIHDARDREIIREKLVDNTSYDALAWKYGLSYERIKDIVSDGRKTIDLYY